MLARILPTIILLCISAEALGAPCRQVKIGLLGEFTRPTARTTQPFGAEIEKGVQLGLESLAFSSAPVCLRPELIDIENSIANIPDLIRNSARDRGIHIFLGLGTSDQALAASAALRETDSVLFTPTASSEQLMARDSRTILLFPRNKQIARFLAQEARRRKISRVVVIYGNNSSYSRDMAKMFSRYFRDSGGTIVREIPVRIGRFSLDEQIVELRKSDFTHLFLPLYELDVAKIVSELKEAGIKKKFIGTDSWGTYSRVIRAMAEGTDLDAILPVIYSPQNTALPNKRFVSSYRRRFTTEPTDLSAFSYDGIRLINAFVSSCPGTYHSRKDLEDCLSNALPFRSVTGIIKSHDHLSLDRPIDSVRSWKE